MPTMPDESLIRAAFAEARTLEPTDGEIAVALARADLRPPRRTRSAGIAWRRFAIPALTALILISSGYAAVPPIRAAIDDVADTFSGFAGSDLDAPGRPLRANETAASGFTSNDEPRVIAESGGYQLQFVRNRDGMLDFDLGRTGVGLGFYLEDLNDHAVYVLGPGAVQNADENGHVPLFGVVAPHVSAVELSYESGPPLRLDEVEDGFVLLADPTRNPQEVIGFDRNGTEVERVSLHQQDGIDIDWSQYGPPAARVPSECLPGAVGNDPPPSCPNG